MEPDELREPFTRDLPGLIAIATQQSWPIWRELFAAWETLVDPVSSASDA